MIKQITLTGADNEIYIPDLIAISDRFPFVEWGILLYDRRMGEPRFPTYGWIKSLIKRKTSSMRLSLHLCSDYTRNAAVKNLKKNQAEIFDGFDRIQFNCTTKFCINRYIHRLDSIPASRNYDMIIKGDFSEVEEVPDFISPLYDINRDTTKISKPHNSRYVGYGGGIHLQNIEVVKTFVNNNTGNTPFWLEMQSAKNINGIKMNIPRCIETLKLMEQFIV